MLTLKHLRLCYANVMMSEKELFIKWLLKVMETQGWSQAEFARRIKISPATVSRVLSGENNPGLDFLQGVALALRMPLDAVMRRAGVLPDHGEVLPEARDWSARLMLLSPERREAVVQAMDNVLQIAEGLPARSRPTR
jgi:transcriptional regulator with XRE-family HTH domain